MASIVIDDDKLNEKQALMDNFGKCWATPVSRGSVIAELVGPEEQLACRHTWQEPDGI